MSILLFPLICLKTAECIANNVDPDQMPHFAAADLGLYYLLMPVRFSTYDKIWCTKLG